MAKVGRPRKFSNRMVAHDLNGDLYVIVDHRLRGTKAEYRCVPVNKRIERFGRAKWIQSADLTNTGWISKKGTVTVYRANEFLEQQLGSRGCECQCCVHVETPYPELDWRTGDYKEPEDDD